MKTCKLVTCCNAVTKVRAKFCSNVCRDRNHQLTRVRTPEALARKKEQDKANSETPKNRFAVHKRNALRRGVKFNMSFDEWWSLWEKHWEGRGTHGLMMCRTRDAGAYEVGNVRIDTKSSNASEAMLLRSNRNG